MNCLVLGGAGFLGSHLAEHLVETGFHVRILVRQGFPTRNITQIIDGVDVIEGGLETPSHIEHALRDVDIVFHLACTTVPATSNVDPVYDVASNLLPTLRFLEAASKQSVKKLVFFSSGGTVYGVPERIPIDEDHPTNPISSYGIHKLAIEKYLTLYKRLLGLDSTILRISNAFGERQRPSSGQGVVAAFLYRALRGEAIEIWGDGSVVRDYVYVSDIVRAAVCCIEASPSKQVFNIGSGVGTSLLEVLRLVEEIVGHRVEVRFAPARAFDVPVNVLDITRAREELRWSPRINLAEGVGRTLRYIKEVAVE